ncbi:sensor histidine kinase [uncultured Microscilla sp.]|uniref:sensor histidine kinase n=1 Tax=uncultured Microscilla sp. TaxID=432653 RepID=UPI0026373C5E|nr:histidine kinase [uncultured Microscilla sp.]
MTTQLPKKKTQMLDKNTQTSSIERALPFVIAFLLPLLNFIGDVARQKSLDMIDFLPRWACISLFLLILWYFNNQITPTKGGKFLFTFLLGNLGLTALYLFILSRFFSNNFQFLSTPLGWAAGLKFLLASWLFTAIQHTLKTAKSVATLKAENLALKSEKYKAELDQLRKQVNPHFLFNSLSTLRTMIRSGNANSEDFVMNLSDVYRQILQTHATNTVTLKEEVDFLNAYIYLLKVRHEDALHVDIQLAPDALAYSLPIYALQLLVENCIKHNIVSTSRPLTIKIYQQKPSSVTVANNYQPKAPQEDSLGVGLDNLRNRYQLMGLDNGLTVAQNEHEYAVTLNLY